MATRTCAACRSLRSDDELVRLCLGTDGRVVVDVRRRLGGRGAWVCPRRGCVELVARKPGLLGRQLRPTGPVQTAGLLDAIRESEREQARAALEQARRAGLLLTGSSKITVAGPLEALVLASDAGTGARRTAATLALTDPEAVADVGLRRGALGRAVGRGPRSLVGALAGRPSRRLGARLRRLRDLG